MYYVSLNNKKEGPLTLEEVIDRRINDDWLIWKEGLDKWEKPSSFPELCEFIVSRPPLLPFEKNIIKKDELYALTVAKFKSTLYKNTIVATIIAIILSILAVIGGSSGGSSEYPVYLSAAEKNNSMLLFWHIFCGTILIFWGIALLFTIVQSIIFYNAKNIK